MFFLDSTGFFSLICLLVQCGMAWIFAGFFGALSRGRGAWLRSWQGAFLGLGIALTALCVRFTLAHHAASGAAVMSEGDLAVRLLYGLYCAGKVLFAWGLVAGVYGLCGVPWMQRGWLAPTIVAVGFAMGLALPTVECILLVQAPWFAWGCAHAARVLQRRSVGSDDVWRRVVVRVLALFALAWGTYFVAVLVVGPLRPQPVAPWIFLLQLNSLIDLVLQVVLACSLIVLVLNDSHRTVIDALRERDRLREQVQRDDKLRALSTLVGGVAHEINNPLTSILGFTDDLASVDPLLRVRAARIVREQAERCRLIVQRMSLLGRGASLVAVEVDMVALVHRVARGLAPQLQQSGVGLQVNSVALSHRFVADATGVEQVLTNLIGNAVHASPRGAVVTVSVSDGRDGLLLEVSDRGVGVPAADRTRIFEPFWTSKKEGQGQGLGLAVVDAIVRAHGGRIEVGDVSGGGARFLVTWPWRPITDAGVELAASPATPSDQPMAPLKPGARLLVIDDDALVRATIARQARVDGWDVVEADSGESGLQLLLAGDARFDAIVCDLRMPGMSGYGLHDELAKRAAQWLSRLVFVTGDLASNEAAQFAARCRVPILTKPFAAVDLMRRLREVGRTA